MQHHRGGKGFSLIELAVVMTIIALILGVIVIGRSMSRSAQLQGVLGDIERFQQAIYNFRTTYSALPGDMSNATAIWGTDPSGCPASNTTPRVGTCNGNGDDKINLNLANGNETSRAWQQLANAGLIEGRYSGAPGPISTFDVQPGNNVPKSPLPEGIYYIDYIAGGSAYHYPMVSHEITFAAKNPSTGMPDQPVISGEEAFAVDQKLDDGLPGMGKITTWKPAWMGMNCADNADQVAARYIMQANIICGLRFLMDF